MNIFIWAILFATMGMVLGAYAPFYLLIVVTIAVIALLVIAAVTDNSPARTSGELGILIFGTIGAICILAPMWLTYLMYSVK